ncbi:sporulation histidine kinase inhibitor Sda [Bacillus sp. FJAT-44742]|nr:sporulation histidine kinase inhibitor Sda [Bacillus sp. FJAT-44742]
MEKKGDSSHTLTQIYLLAQEKKMEKELIDFLEKEMRKRKLPLAHTKQ